MTTVPELCPSCLNELPAGYPYDHVAIDRALRGDRTTFAAMSTAERAETVITGLARGIDLGRLAHLLTWPYFVLQALLPDDHPNSHAAERARNEQAVRDLWAQNLPDVTIAARTGLNPSVVGRTRKRLGLPSVAGRGFRKVVAA